jgi:hypothetical protein
MVKEYRVVYRRDGREQFRDGFPKKDINWGGYFHNIKQHEIIRWEERTTSPTPWIISTSEDPR